MIRFLKAFAWLRWRLLINGLRGARRRDAIERLSRIAALVAPALLLFVSLGLAVLAGILGLAGGWAAGSGSVQPPTILILVRVVLLVALVIVLFAALSAPTGGAIAGYRRLLLLPISRRALHLVELIARAADPWVLFVIPGVIAFAVGLMVAGRALASAVALIAGVAFIILLAALISLLSFFVSWLMRSRRRGELFTLGVVLAFSLIGMIPAFLSGNLERRARESKATGAARERLSIERIDNALPVWSRALPSELYGRTIQLGLGGRYSVAGICLGALLLEGATLYWISAAMHRKLIDSVESSGVRRASRRWLEGLRLPGLSAAASAVAIAQARGGLRSVRGRLIVLMPGPLVAAMSLLSRRVPGAVPGGSFLGSDGYVVLGAGIVFSLYALQAFSMNQFASDRAGLTFEFLAPISDEDLAKGKTVGCAMILGAAVLISLICSLIVGWGGSPFMWLSVLLGGAATYMLISPVATLMSALFPHASDLSKTGTGGNPHGFAFLVGSLLTIALSALSGLIITIGQTLLQRPELALLLMALWTLLAAAVSIPGLRLAARAVASRRENLALVSHGR